MIFFAFDVYVNSDDYVLFVVNKVIELCYNTFVVCSVSMQGCVGCLSKFECRNIRIQISSTEKCVAFVTGILVSLIYTCSSRWQHFVNLCSAPIEITKIPLQA